ncbi:bifunctional 4-hydroxy-2-oxoglutarate aldolase/2-dehydro-3-deoxy-phosphogluconate aldolase [Allopusillimonas soli]|uniref:2-dehydro-3-deoxy-phosphogluconate aldolase n=1 Tax=Allopusillimonas soli TaxID=659016 RepID=A0A853FEX0_9BURK|nr:bifunctional 4-hydroxy-2-oxoglutarate aldolase/2-dehydro-3-deoxy-phosphogluconate aldolase [Allopusillimonas soli]NYT38232.1 bifunctional 4-hydroxy-2-oxoglutarate aldolase/2-dehydro-3-deoxy-phosphogluconate aldolase [Allopusillimonas soli]TEA72189.1 bifunctional 4-hydroxy-2-oxoglutarate aldolase/2-dehydro-3-deoxy-phosphogluconate aldolase [Allopusillimonas soli]
MNALQVLESSPVLPVIVIHDMDVAVELAHALVRGGVSCLEITLRSEAALEAIAHISREVPEALVGAGTLRNARQLEAALRAGARFGVSPGLTPELAAAARNADVPFLPGVATASESMIAADAGFTVQKLFPAQAVGGVALLKALYGPMPDIAFCPTGGINATNAGQYMALPNVKCVGGSWLTPDDAVARRQWDEITALARQACALRTAS